MPTWFFKAATQPQPFPHQSKNTGGHTKEKAEKTLTEPEFRNSLDFVIVIVDLLDGSSARLVLVVV